jgi:DNA-binding NarL/FixJ family response regulator
MGITWQPIRALVAMSSPSRPLILLVEDHALVRLGFRALAQAHTAALGQSMETHETASLAEALCFYEAQRPRIGLVLLDLTLPDAQGLEGLAVFRARFPDAQIAVLSGSALGVHRQGAFALGAVAWLRKSDDLRELAEFLRRWHEEGVIPPEMTLGASDAAPARQALGARQTQVLRHVMQGRSNREIGDAMHLSEGTVKNHITHLLLYFGMRSRAQLISQLRTST